jgi:hypothetical protein
MRQAVNKGDILQIKITLTDVQPAVWRRVLVPASLPLRRLHETIQVVMGWLNQHFYEFRIGTQRLGLPEAEGGHASSAISNDKFVQLALFIERGIDRFDYIYDNWQHQIAIENIRPGEPGVDYPVFVEGARHCPPEDCGGPSGFQEFLKAITNPTHPERSEVLDWYGDLYDPDDIEREIIDALMSRIANSRRGGLKARGRPRIKI